jgi:methionyl-tRNA formyltransferase
MEAIYEIGGSLEVIMSIPDHKSIKKSGRFYVDEFANKHNIPIVKTNHINDQLAIDTIKEYDLDWLFIIGWSQIASEEVIAAPKMGAIGAHPTLLPVGRGRAAIPWAIIKGLDITGVTFFKMDKGVDTGLILGQQVVPILPDETATTLYGKVNIAHEVLIKKLYKDLENNRVKGEVQDESKATYWEGRKPHDGEISAEMTMQQVDRLVRATTKPYPGAFVLKNDKKIIIWKGFASQKQQQTESWYELKLQDGYFYAEIFDTTKS